MRPALRALLPLLLAARGVTAEEPASHVIRWVGTGFQEGDAFTITARISAKRVDLHWDGFSDHELRIGSPPPRNQKEFAFTDEATVRAFVLIAQQSEQWDPGPSEILGTSAGLTIKAEVEAPPGQMIRQIRGFHSPDSLVKPDRMAAVPFLVKGLAREKIAAEVPADTKLSRHLRDLAGDLSRFERGQSALLAACRIQADLPLEELESIRAPLPLARAIEHRRLTLPEDTGRRQTLFPRGEPGR